jgi:hypothetical protein
MPASRFVEWVGTAECGVTQVTRVTIARYPSISAALEVGPEIPRAANRKVTKVTPPSPSAIAVTPVFRYPNPRLQGKSLANHAGNPGNVSNLKIQERSVFLNAASDPASWRNHFKRLLALGGIYREPSGENAEGPVFENVILRWHLRFGASPDPHRCAGCGDKLEAEAGLLLGDARVHLDGMRGINCVTAYGRKWRGSAIKVLGVLGMDPPPGYTP